MPPPSRGAARLRAEISALASAHTDAATDRALTSRDAADVARACLPQLGITRLARVTGLDRLGVPVWTAIRPNAASLSVCQGKGTDDDAAIASAIFEAAEIATAELPHPAAFRATPATLAASGGELLDVRRYLRRDVRPLGPDESESWVEGLDLIAGDAVAVPEDVVRVADTPGCRYWQTSDGLGTGSNVLEAAIHGICELIERDAMALWSFLPDTEIARREIGPAALGDAVAAMASRIEAAGFGLRLFDATSDIAVPTYLSVLFDAAKGELGYMDLASGSGTHPSPARAALRAITEAAQTRLTTITGSRDDVDPAEYIRTLPADLRLYTNEARPAASAASGYTGKRSLSGYCHWLVEQVRSAGIRSLVLVDLEARDFPFVVARALAPELEQDPRSGNRKPGRRLLRAMMRAA
ncbi:MAG TPA: YcaO-like family protein [Bauldia sp.]|nr:YcaO-like family protein [Bauldia sp.]